MFYHRVLPLPPPKPSVDSGTRSSSFASPSSSIPVSINSNEDSMTNTANRASISYPDPGRPRTRSFKGQEEYTAQSRDIETSSPIALRSSTRLSQKADTVRSPSARPEQPHQTRLPSISREGDLTTEDSAAHQVCLCQPDPKIPRPRNAFILFRQHHQAAVVSQNPGLANPDISKIIGDAWQNSSEEVKDHWKGLAEDEKVRHQKQYPDYRYQPRRAGRNSLPSSVATDPETQRCLKCGGKTMQTYNSLPTPGTPQSPRAAPPNLAMGGNTIFSRGSHYIGSPSYPPGSVDARRFPPPTSNGSSMPLRHRESNPHDSPNLKRRRYDGPISPPTHSGSVPSSFSQPGRRPSMPHPEISTRGHSSSISRPPNTSGHPVRAPGPALAPLYIDKSRDAASQSKAVEAMVMSIPALNKIKVLAKISPPLPIPGPASPPHETRGALVAIEGSDEAAIKLTATYLENYLQKDGVYKVRLLLRPLDSTFEENASWLSTIMAYHKESREIIKYITTVPVPENQKANSTSRQDSKDSSEDSKKDSDDEDVPMSSAPPSPAIKTPNPFNQPREAIPIIIAPRYQLSLTDIAASQIPITDEYSPTDHWQWMATLWRGIIGPDVTIEVKTSTHSHGGSSGTPSPRNPVTGPGTSTAAPRSSGESPIKTKDVNMTGVSTSSGGSGGAVSQGNANSPPACDVRLQDARAVFLRGDASGKLGESALRRMAFEVGEWIRDVESREHEREIRESRR